MSISESLRSAIQAAICGGATRYRIARNAGVDQTALSRFLAQRRDIRVSTVDGLAEALGLELRRKSVESECKE